jgi:Tfp pilus assembly protein PilX
VTNREPAGAKPATEQGTAIIFVLLAMMLLSALGMALALSTSAERQVATTYGSAVELFYAADAGFETAVHDLAQTTDWNVVLNGATSTFIDGAPGQRVLADASVLDLARATDVVNCGRSPCSMADMQATTAARPWGANNPVWRLYAYGPVSNLSPSGAVDSSAYVVVWVADDPLETDGQPLVDGDTSGANPGAGIIQLLVHAYGPFGMRRVIEGTLKRGDTRTRVLSWREVRQSS